MKGGPVHFYRLTTVFFLLIVACTGVRKTRIQSDASVLLAEANDRLRAMDYIGAVAKYREASRLDSNNADLFVNWGTAYGRMGQFTQAIEMFRRAVRITPYHVQANLNCGIALASMGNHQDAGTYFENAAKYDEKNSEVYFRWGYSLQARNLFSDALEKYRKALSIDPRHGESRINLAICYARTRQYENAIFHFEKAVRLPKTIPAMYYYWGKSYEGKGDTVKAVEKFKTYIGLEKDQSDDSVVYAKNFIAQYGK